MYKLIRAYSHPIKIDPDDFERWLLNHPEESVGISVDACYCPLALYLREKNNDYFYVLGKSITDRNGNELPYPRWARNFVYFTDNVFFRSQPVTKQDALLCLRAARRSFLDVLFGRKAV